MTSVIGNGFGLLRPVVPPMEIVPESTVEPPLVNVQLIDKLPAENLMGMLESESKTLACSWLSDNWSNEKLRPVNLGELESAAVVVVVAATVVVVVAVAAVVVVVAAVVVVAPATVVVVAPATVVVVAPATVVVVAPATVVVVAAVVVVVVFGLAPSNA